MSDKQPELCQVGDRESGRLCRLPSSRLPSWGAAASTLKPWELGTQSRPEVLHWAASGLWFQISARGGAGAWGAAVLLSGVGAEAGLSPSVRFWGLGSARPLPAGAEPGWPAAGRGGGSGQACTRCPRAAAEGLEGLPTKGGRWRKFQTGEGRKPRVAVLCSFPA